MRSNRISPAICSAKGVKMVNALREYKEKKGLTVGQLAKKLGCSQRQAQRFLAGKPMSALDAIYFSKILGIRKEDIVFTQQMLEEYYD